VRNQRDTVADEAAVERFVSDDAGERAAALDQLRVRMVCAQVCEQPLS